MGNDKTEIKQQHSYSEFHNFGVDGVANLSCSSHSVAYDAPNDNTLILRPDRTFTDAELEKLRDLLNEFLEWKRYGFSNIIERGERLNVVTSRKDELERMYPTNVQAEGDATGEPV